MSMQEDPFASVRLKSRNILPERNVQATQNNNQNNQEDPFSSVRVKKSQDFPLLYETGRHAARISSRIAETIGGIPGDVSSLIQSGIFSGLERLVGHKASPEAHQELKKYRMAPTSKELKDFSQHVTKDFTKPQGAIEEGIDEFAETAASLLGPMKFRKVLGVSLASNLAKQGLKIAGLGEGTQEFGKLGTMFLASVYNPNGALKYATSQYDKANALSRGASTTAVPLEGHLVNIANDLKYGVSTPAKAAVIKPIEELVGKIKNGKISVKDLTSAKRDLNSLIIDPALLKREKKLLLKVGKEIDLGLKPYEKINPAFSEAYRPAQEIYGAVMQGQKASNFLKRTLGAKSILGAVAGEALLGQPELILPTLGTAAVAFGGAKTADFFTRLAKSPELQKFYAQAMAAAAIEDAPALRLYSDKIEKAIEKD